MLNLHDPGRTSTYRYKRPPKKWKANTIKVQAIVHCLDQHPRLENQEDIMPQDDDDPRVRYAKAERERTEAKRALARAKLDTARAEWEMVHMKTQAAMERAKRQRAS